MMSEPQGDLRVQQEVIEELAWDILVRASAIGVSVDDGVVTLSGTVDSYGKKLAAEHAAHRVRGVLDVANDIAVQPEGNSARSDTEIAHAVRTAMEWNLLVPDRRIRTTVSNGYVTLEGDVETVYERDEAEHVARRLAGVRGVHNHIHVNPIDLSSDDIRLALEQALERRASREAERIQVEVERGVVTLTGRVHSWREKRAVLGAVGHSQGVHLVKDNLRIDPYF
jgi:osmotically-inducible protein OsmY